MDGKAKTNTRQIQGNQFTRSLRKIAQSREIGLALALLVVCLVLSLVTRTFTKFTNIMNVLKQVTLTALIATSQTFVITAGGIDLSVGFVMGLGSIVMCELISFGVWLPVAILACLVTCVAFGALNGVLITRLRLPPFIITLGMTYICKGLINVLTEGYTIMIQNNFIMQLGQGSVGKVPIMVLFLPVVAVAMSFLYNRTLFGNHVKGIGGNENACHLSGIDVNKTKVLVYALNGLLCGLVGVIITGRLNAGNPNAGVNYDMNTIGAVIIGGTAISGGSGTVLGSILGAVLLGIIRNGLTLLKVNMYWETVATGAIIILVCALDILARKRRR
jgi:ribose transport system permease protein